MMLAKLAFMIRPYRLRRVFLVTRSTMATLRRRRGRREPARVEGEVERTTREHPGRRWTLVSLGPGSGSGEIGVERRAPLALGAGAVGCYTAALHIARLHIAADAVPTPKGSMVRLTLYHIMRRRGITAYALSRGTGLSYPSAYRMSRPAGTFGRLHSDTLERLCEFSRCSPASWSACARGGTRGL